MSFSLSTVGIASLAAEREAHSQIMRALDQDNREKIEILVKLREELGKAFVVRLDTGKFDDARAYKLPGRQ